MGIPIVSRLSLCLVCLSQIDMYSRGYVALVLGIGFLMMEACIRFVTLALPPPVLKAFYQFSRRLWNYFGSGERLPTLEQSLHDASDFSELCELFGYEAENHVIKTEDGYLLGLHRLNKPKNMQVSSSRKPVVYLHHGLMMNSEVWVCQIQESKNLAFVLVEAGYDVWLGNNRGNKYSKKHSRRHSFDHSFWDFSMDEFALYDIPDSIDYILGVTRVRTLSYIGFSQGTAQAFATLSIHPQLNEKVNLFIALAPALSPHVDALIKSSPTLLYLFFGRQAMLTSAAIWQNILYPPIFTRILDVAMNFLFGWTCQAISPTQKYVSYAHLYSFTSVKSVVHWFQIIQSRSFQFYDDFTQGPVDFYGKAFYKVPAFPTRNIHTPIVLLYGGRDPLVSINAILAQLPQHTISREIAHYEHLDFLWAHDVDKHVNPQVLDFLAIYSCKGNKQESLHHLASSTLYSLDHVRSLKGNDDCGITVPKSEAVVSISHDSIIRGNSFM